MFSFQRFFGTTNLKMKRSSECRVYQALSPSVWGPLFSVYLTLLPPPRAQLSSSWVNRTWSERFNWWCKSNHCRCTIKRKGNNELLSLPLHIWKTDCASWQRPQPSARVFLARCICCQITGWATEANALRRRCCIAISSKMHCLNQNMNNKKNSVIMSCGFRGKWTVTHHLCPAMAN